MKKKVLLFIFVLAGFCASGCSLSENLSVQDIETGNVTTPDCEVIIDGQTLSMDDIDSKGSRARQCLELCIYSYYINDWLAIKNYGRLNASVYAYNGWSLEIQVYVHLDYEDITAESVIFTGTSFEKGFEFDLTDWHLETRYQDASISAKVYLVRNRIKRYMGTFYSDTTNENILSDYIIQ